MGATCPSASASLSLFLRSLLPRLFLLPGARPPPAEGGCEQAQAHSAGSVLSSREPVLSPAQHRALPFEFVTVDASSEPQLAAFLALPSVPSLVCFYRRKMYSVLAPGASDAALLRFLREAADLAEASGPSQEEKTAFSRVAPHKAAEAVNEARAEAASGLQGGPFAGVSALGSKRTTATEAVALAGAWAERKDVQCLLTRLEAAMAQRQAEEVQRLNDELATDCRREDAVLTGGRRLFAELQLRLTRGTPPDRKALTAVLTEILGGALSLPESLHPAEAAAASRHGARSVTAAETLRTRRKTGAAEQWASLYDRGGFWDELETSPACARLLARATVALFDHERANLQELDLWMSRLDGDEPAEWGAVSASFSEALREVLEAEEPVRPLDEAVHFAHVTTKNERDLARYRPSVFFLSSSSLLSCPLRTASRLHRLKAARRFHQGGHDEALGLAVRAYRLECQGAAGRRDTAPAHVLGKWRDDEATLHEVDASHDRIGGNGTEDLFDQMTCARAGWPARALVMAMYMALGAKHPAVQRSRAELEVVLGTDGFVPVVFPHTRARPGGKPIMMRGKSGKWHWLGPYWKPPWAPSNRARWPTGPEEWAWSDPTR
ncbi:conserved hypothetical protein [Neospora caninum Liverpool]|nr:conserved hypothetical protein [Neospora caninum Liverpool]CBZ52624.1 conserved hypothetical protein [Neospora caninum Liverpool]|eukprot:XP_003882656.1 conserved hypothetical protein [Neospora caninum Liverpool]